MDLEEGLRARKNRETREAIHRAAVRRALAADPDSVTIADISAEANVSTRTFFNYFPSKEDAMIGFHEELPTEAELAEFTAARSDDLLRDIVILMRDVFSSSPANTESMRERRALVQEHPQLMQRQMTRIYAVEQRIAGAVAERMRACADSRQVSDVDAAARMLVMLSTSVVRFAIREFMHNPGVQDGHDEDRALDAALNTLREVTHKIT